MPSEDVNQIGLTGEFRPYDFARGNSLSPEGAQQAGEAQADETHPLEMLVHEGQSARAANLVLAGLFIAGMACVYLLSLHDGPARATAQQQAAELQVDSALKRLQKPAKGSAKPEATAQEMINDLFERVCDRQVPLSNLRGNPFAFVPQAAAPVLVKDDKTNRMNPATAALQRAEALRLQSIVVAENGTAAVISDNLLTVGQKVAGWTVAAIRGRCVVLKWKKLTYVLKMRE